MLTSNYWLQLIWSFMQSTLLKQQQQQRRHLNQSKLVCWS